MSDSQDVRGENVTTRRRYITTTKQVTRSGKKSRTLPFLLSAATRFSREPQTLGWIIFPSLVVFSATRLCGSFSELQGIAHTLIFMIMALSEPTDHSCCCAQAGSSPVSRDALWFVYAATCWKACCWTSYSTTFIGGKKKLCF